MNSRIQELRGKGEKEEKRLLRNNTSMHLEMKTTN